jgi:hypothetical protein
MNPREKRVRAAGIGLLRERVQPFHDLLFLRRPLLGGQRWSSEQHERDQQ